MGRTTIIALTVMLELASAAGQAQAPASNVDSRLATSRAVEAMIWGVPAVNADLMRQEMLAKTAAKANDILFWYRRLDCRQYR